MTSLKRTSASGITLMGFAISLISAQAYAAPNCVGTPIQNPSIEPMSVLNTAGTCVQFGDKLFGNFNLTVLIAAGGSNVVFSVNGNDHNIGFDSAGTYTQGSTLTLSYEVQVNMGTNTITSWSGDIIETTGNESTLTKTITPVGSGAGGTINCVDNGTPVPPQVVCPQTIPVNLMDATVAESAAIGTTANVSSILDTIVQSTPTNLSDSEQPGSVIVFPKFVGGAPGVAGSVGQVSVDGHLVSVTEIEIGAVCPADATCTPHQSVVVQFHWVCPGFEGVNSNICPENSFQVVLSTDGKLAFSADGIPINTNSPRVPPPLCPRGYLIGWVVNQFGAAAVPIKFDGLVGNGILRGVLPSVGGAPSVSTGVSAYQAIPIQANPVDATNAVLSVPLDFDGLSGGYSQVTGVQIGDVKFDRAVSSSSTAITPDVLSETFLNFLTLDVVSGRPNNPTFVPYFFFNESDAAPSATNPLFENTTDGRLSFVCWTQLNLATIPSGPFGGPIDASLTQAFQGTRKGLVIAGPAEKVADGNAPGDGTGPVTLIGLVETIEGTAANNFQERRYNYVMSNDSVPVPTTFVP